MRTWTRGNTFRLLENGETYFPRVFEAIEHAREEVVLETFIWSQDKTGHRLLEALVGAAERGVRVCVTVDGYGSPGFSDGFLSRLREAGVRVYSFDPKPTLFRVRTNMLCRLHRKTVIVDREVAFIGGINFGDVHLRDFGTASKQDYGVEVCGPVVTDIHAYCTSWFRGAQKWRPWRYWVRKPKSNSAPDGVPGQALFAIRDNDAHPTDIETLYRLGIRRARRSIVIANAYFFPGFRFIRDLRRAARRGVDVTLIVQGNADRPLAVGVASIVYEDLLGAGVRIYEYVERSLHAKVAVADEDWATVGSSNLDPISFGLNLEANLFIRDKEFTGSLRDSLEVMMRQCCEPVRGRAGGAVGFWRRLLLTAAYHFTRLMRSWGRRMPFDEQQVEPMRSGSGVTAEPTDPEPRDDARDENTRSAADAVPVPTVRTGTGR